MKEPAFPKFKDFPSRDQILPVIDSWRKPEIPEALENLTSAPETITFRELAASFRKIILAAGSHRHQKRLQKSILDWLYSLIRLNIKRGREYNLCIVLETGQADCLGYAKILTALGRYSGLELGVIEVIIDNRGRNVPHTATLAVWPDHTLQFIDFWYGSKNIKHRRLGLKVKRGGKWQIEDINYADLKNVEAVSYLPDYCVDAITLYIEGNRSLKNKDYLQAVRQYTRSIRRYPHNARTFYNRAVAYENLGELEKAKQDYARALRDETSLFRTLAAQPGDIVNLICLDEENISELDQQVYLLHQGFITGKKVPPSKIASKIGISKEEVAKILEKRLAMGAE